MCLINVSGRAGKSEELNTKRLEMSRKMSLEELKITIKNGYQSAWDESAQKQEKNKIKSTILPETRETQNVVYECSTNPKIVFVM